MSFTSQLPPIPLAQASPTLRALVQAAGQNIEAKVLGPLPNGAVQVQIGRQVISLQMPEMPPIGTTLTLAMQQVDGQVRVALVSSRPPPAPGTPAQPQPAAPPNAPATSIQLSPAALAATPAQSAPPPSSVPQASVAAPAVQVAPSNGPVSSAAPPAPPGAAVTMPAAMPVAGQAAAATPSAPAPGGAMPMPAQPQAAGVVPTNPVTSGAPILPTAVPVAGPAAAVPAAPSGNPVARQANPYVAAVTAPNAVPSAGAGTTGSAGREIAAPLAGGNVGQNPTPQNAPAGTGARVVPTAPPAPAQPGAVLAQMVQQALPRQDSVIGLTTALANVVGRVALPDAVVKAAQQVLGQRLTLDRGKLDGATLQAAVRNSGIFQEAMLAGGKAPGGDMKSALLGLQRQLGAWLGNQAPVEQPGSVAPPLKGLTPRARQADLPTPDLPDDPELAGKILLERTEAALSRLRLHQNASLPEPQAHRNEAQWSLDLPVSVAGHQALLQMQIHRDPDDEAVSPEDRGWQVRFAINLSEAGEVGAQISLRRRQAGVLLWADDEETAEILAAHVEELRQDLEAAGLLLGAVVVRTGAPAHAPAAAASGNLLDEVR